MTKKHFYVFPVASLLAVREETFLFLAMPSADLCDLPIGFRFQAGIMIMFVSFRLLVT